MNYRDDWPRPRDILRLYAIQLRSLEAGLRAEFQAPLDPITDLGDLRGRFDRAQIEIGQQVTLALAASFEAAFMSDYHSRTLPKALRPFTVKGVQKRDPRIKIFRRLQAKLKRCKRPRATLDEILDCWNEVDDKMGRHRHRQVGRLRQLMEYRHWLAHGRNWNQTSGLTVADPLFASEVGYVVFSEFADENQLFSEIAQSLAPRR